MEISIQDSLERESLMDKEFTNGKMGASMKEALSKERGREEENLLASKEISLKESISMT